MTRPLITAPAGNSMSADIDRAIKLMIEAAQCIDRVHRDVFPGYDERQEEMMDKADAAQKRLRDARKTVQKMRVLYDSWGEPE
jgi:hypothetical protein